MDDKIREGIKWESIYTHSQSIKGGQVCGMPKIVKLTHEELGVSIECSYYRSQIENREACEIMLNALLNQLTR
jgi:protein subunit release factor B